MTPTETVRNADSAQSRNPYVVLPENRLAYTAVALLLRRYNPPSPALVYLFGPKGSGKSHLAGHLIRANHRRKQSYRCIHVSAKTLLSYAHDGPMAGQDAPLPRRLNPQQLELFVCEDLHEIGQGSRTDPAVQSILEAILESSARVLLTSRKPVGQLNGFSSRLINRCHAGINVQLLNPSYPSRLALISYFARNKQIPASTGAFRILARELAVSPAFLLEALTELDAFARRQNREISAELAEAYLQTRSTPKRLATADIVEAVARGFGVTVADLRSRSRVEGLSVPRQCAMYLARELTGEPFEEISRFFNGRSHSAVIHACGRFQSRLASHPELQRRLADVRQALTGS